MKMKNHRRHPIPPSLAAHAAEGDAEAGQPGHQPCGTPGVGPDEEISTASDGKMKLSQVARWAVPVRPWVAAKRRPGHDQRPVPARWNPSRPPSPSSTCLTCSRIRPANKVIYGPIGRIHDDPRPVTRARRLPSPPTWQGPLLRQQTYSPQPTQGMKRSGGRHPHQADRTAGCGPRPRSPSVGSTPHCNKGSSTAPRTTSPLRADSSCRGWPSSTPKDQHTSV